jgi:hypothetical protein
MPKIKTEKLTLVQVNGFTLRNKIGNRLPFDIDTMEDGKKQQIQSDLWGLPVSISPKARNRTWIEQHQGGTACKSTAERQLRNQDKAGFQGRQLRDFEGRRIPQTKVVSQGVLCI